MRFLGLLLLVAACSERTEIVVGVATDLKARGQIDKVTFTASREGKTIIEHPWELSDLPAGHYELPGSFGLYSPDGSAARVELSLKGFRGDLLVSERDALVSLVPDQTLFMRLGLVGDCGVLSQPTCEAGLTCVEGVCRPREVDGRRLPKYRKELVTSVECDSGTHFVISSTGEPMPTLGGCESDEICQEGTCYKLLSGEDGSLSQGLWTQQPSGTTWALRAIWGTPDGADVFAVGDHGTILHLAGAGPSWAPETSNSTANLYALWGSSAADVWAAGQDGTFVHRDATGWSVTSLPMGPRIDGLSGNWAVGRSAPDAGVWLHLESGAWQTKHQGGDVRGVHAAADDDVWGVGHGTVLHWDGSNFSTPTAPPGDYHAVSGGYIVGRGGVILKDLVALNSGVSVDLFAVHALGSEVYVVGDYGTVLHLESGAWVRQTAETGEPLFAVWGSSSGELFAVGRDGVLLHSTGQMQMMGPTLCSGDADCAMSSYCDPTGACLPRKAQGTNCDDTTECKQPGCRLCVASLFCTDHVCCDQSPTQCSGCRQCSAPTGTCGMVPNGQDPHATCAGMTGECKQTSCNGSGGCGTSGDPCGSTTCATGALTTHTCQSGSCAADPSPIPCPGPAFSCMSGTTCTGACSGDGDCTASEYCDNNRLCRPRKAQGGACNPTSHCYQAGCHECDGSFTCIDGYCCNGPCSGKCEACDVVPGTCSNVPSGQPHGGRGNCPGMGVGACGGYCDGSGPGCFQPSGTCAAASCANGYTRLTATSCDTGTGTCPSQTPVDCGRKTCVSGGCVNCTLGGSCNPTIPMCNAVTGACAFANGDRCSSGDGSECGSNFCIGQVCCEGDCPPNNFGCWNPSDCFRSFGKPTSCALGVGKCVYSDSSSCGSYVCQIGGNCQPSCTCASGTSCASSPQCCAGHPCINGFCQ